MAVATGALAMGFSAHLAVRAVSKDELGQLRLGLRSLARDAEWGNGVPGAVGQFLRQLSLESREAERVELLRERLAEVDWATWGVAGRIGAWGRVALFSGSAAAIGQLSSTMAASQPGLSAYALIPFACGALFAVGCHWIGRATGKAAEERRQAWDALSAAIVRPLSSERPIRRLRDGTGTRHSPRSHEQQQVKVR